MTAESEYEMPRGRTGFGTLSLYEEQPERCSADLSDNTNLWGMPPAAERALKSFSGAGARGYPSAYTPALKEVLASRFGVSPSMIVTGCGSDDVLDSAIRAFGNSGSRLAYSEPTFSMIPVLARVNGLIPVSARFDNNWDITVDELLSSDPEIIYICSPNNPTGTSARIERIERVARSFRGLVIVDEAYGEYAASSLISLAGDYSNVLVTRTMSKAFGMAGLRLGYGIGNPALVREVEKSRGPYKVSTIAESAGIAALTSDLPWVGRIVEETLVNRARLVGLLHSLGYAPLRSDANFILLPVQDASTVAAKLLSQGVGVRPFTGLPGIGDAIRVTIGPWKLMQTFLDELERSVV